MDRIFYWARQITLTFSKAPFFKGLVAFSRSAIVSAKYQLSWFGLSKFVAVSKDNALNFVGKFNHLRLLLLRIPEVDMSETLRNYGNAIIFAFGRFLDWLRIVLW